MTFLPREILFQRIRNEVATCRDNLPYPVSLKNEKMSSFPVVIYVNMQGCPGPILINDRLTHIYQHDLTIILNEKYPYVRPLIQWKSDIFHPNIMPGHEGGEVCSKLLDTWNFNSDLLSLIKGLESLLINPNPKNPWGTDTCTRAAEYLNKNSYTPPVILTIERKKPVIISKRTSCESHLDTDDDVVSWTD